MSRRPTIHYLNADFDLRLRARSEWRAKTALVQQVAELSWQALLGTEPDDTVLVTIEPPAEFVEHLDRIELSAATIRTELDPSVAGSFAPYGWSEETIEINHRLAEPALHPPLEIIRRVNTRSYALQLEQTLGIDSAAGTMLRSLEALETHVGRQSPGDEWIIKGQHGNSGTANRRLRAPALEEPDRRFAKRCLEQDDQLLVERWLPRERDWCVVFDVPFDRESLRLHESYCTRDGALIGALFDPRGDPPAALHRTAAIVAEHLHGTGYFGPVCLDAFSWREGHVLGLREMVDLNCRQSMSASAHRAWQRIAPRQTLYYRFFNRTKLRLAPTLALATEALADRAFDPQLGRGILFTSPLHCGKLSMMFVESDRAGVFALERWFRERFEK